MSPLPTARVLHPRFSTHHQGVAAGTMTGTCHITGLPGKPVYDPTTGSSTPVLGPVEYDGPCRIRPYMRATLGDQAGQEITSRRYVVTITADAAAVAESSTVKVMTCDDDQLLVGRVLSVEDVQYGTTRFERVLICIDNLG